MRDSSSLGFPLAFIYTAASHDQKKGMKRDNGNDVVK